MSRSPIPREHLAVVACLCLAVGVAAAPLASTPALGTHQEDRTTNGFKAYTPGGEIPNPGDMMTVELYMVPAFMEEEGPIPEDVEIQIDYQGYYTTTTSHCDTQDVYALGVDRGNDDPGTNYDEDLVQSLKENGESEQSPADDPAQMTTNDDWDHRQFTWLDLAGEDSLQPTMNLNQDGTEDESILAVEECVEMPAAGWHRTFGMLNGTIEEFHSDRDEVVIDGESHQEGDRFQIWESSLWYPVCDCEESRHVAMRLDPPPGPMTPGSEGGVYHPNGTIEAPYAEVDEDGNLVYEDFTVPPENVTSEGIHFHDGFLELTGPIYYAAGHVEEDGTIVTPSGDRIEPEEDESPPAPTPTPTETDGDDGTGDDTDDTDGTGDDTDRSGDETDGTGDETDGTGDETDGSGDDTDGTDGMGDDTDGSGDETDGSGDDSDETDGTAGDTDGTGDDPGDATPTAGDGPGLGAVAALAALAAVALLARRLD